MKVEYDKETDILTITLRDARVKESDEVRPGVIADFGYDGGVVGFEILDASEHMEKPMTMEYAVAEPAAVVRERPAKYRK
ncbi:MAG: DUF2283 domain-containing protein [Verrucomicrobiota bacterium]